MSQGSTGDRGRGSAGRGQPLVPMLHLDTLWFQVSGTICNLRCTHCFISCAPDNHSHGMMSLQEVRRFLDEATRLGVREYYFTGGEPFMNREFLRILEETLDVGPATVLTNGLFLDPRRCRRLREMADAGEYSLEIRVSLDGWGPADHDAIRGPGTFRRTLEGIRNLWEFRLNPVITITEAVQGVACGDGRARFLSLLRSFGLSRPRLKILPLLRIGAEEARTRGYEPWERLTADAVTPEGLASLQCSCCRMVTSRGVYVCPILIEEPRARMGSSIAETLRPFELAHSACYTCYARGLTCTT
ncbi:MAG: radical SAM protein [Acidobacteriota bacterium]